MRALLTALYPAGGRKPFGGVQSWQEAVAAELRRRGYSTTCWGPEFAAPSGRFDLHFGAHFLHMATAAFEAARALWISHGVIAAEEPPRGGAIAYTSEEVASRWDRPGIVVRQPIDLEFWAPDPATERRLFLLHSYRAPSAFGLPRIAETLGLDFFWQRNGDNELSRSLMRRAALVCASGRTALEAMACGAPTVICDHRPYQGGPMMTVDLEEAMRRNYSGRGGIHPLSVDFAGICAEAMRRGDPRGWIEQRHDARRIIEELVAAAC